MPHIKWPKWPVHFTLLALALHAPAHAAGLYLWEFGHPAQGASGAGAGALAEDASVAFINPAGIVNLDAPHAMATGVLIDSSIKFSQDAARAAIPPSVPDADGNRPADNGGDAGSVMPAGAVFYARPVNETWGWGVSMVSTSGALLEYERPLDFAGRYWGQRIELLTISLTPALSYRVSDNFSLGFGIPVMLGTIDMETAVPRPLPSGPEGQALIKNGSDVSATFLVSAQWRASPRLDLGAVFMGENEVAFDGDLKFRLPSGQSSDNIATDVAFTFPSTLRTWAAYALNDRVSLLGTVAWENWSAYDSILISTPAGGGALRKDWDDTWHFGAGVKISTDGPWTWTTGVAYDTDPTRPEDRSADTPIDEQWRLSVGATYQRASGHRVGLVMTYADYGDAAIDNGGTRPLSGLPWTVKGRYSTNRIIFLGLNYGW